MAEAIIFLANGTEECEALLVVDILRRAKISIEMVSVEDTTEIISAHQVRIQCDKTLDEVSSEEVDLLIVPGGLEGTNRMKANTKLTELLLKHREKSGNLAAVCAGPSVLGSLGLLSGRVATAYPGFGDKLGAGANFQDEAVIHDRDVITGRGLGASIPFALKLVELLRDHETAKQIAQEIVYFD